MPLRLAAIPILALFFGAIDTVLVRRAFEHRDLGPELYLHSVLLWAALGGIMLVPALVVGRLRRRPGSEPSAEGRGATGASAAQLVASQALWTGAPVALHQTLDRYTDLGGNLSGLLSVSAVLGIALTVGILILLGLGLRVLLGRVGAGKLGAVVAVGSVAAGLLLPLGGGAGGATTGAVTAADGAAGAAGARPDSERPNVLLMIWDTSRAKSVSLYGYDRTTTPNLAALADSSLTFRFARSVSSYTLTSHLSMMTGVYPSHHGARLMRQIYDPYETPTVTQDFAAAGYRTGAFVGTSVLSAGTGFNWGFEVFDDQVDPGVADTKAWALVHDVQAVLAKLLPALFHNNGLPHWFQDFQRPADEVLARAADWIAQPDPRPWFCLINMYDVHWPYLPAEAHREQWVDPYEGPATGYLTRANGWDEDQELDEDDRVHVRQLYDAEMHELDAKVGAFLAGLDLDRTALIITSDHGEAFGESGRWEHNDILECQLRVPLLVRPAGGVEGRSVETRASGVDMAPTLLDLAGLLDEDAGLEGQGTDPTASRPRFFGRSLLREVGPRELLVEDRDHLDKTDVRIALYHDRWKLVRLGIGDAVEYHLFDLETDRNGLRDVVEEHPEVVADLIARMDALRARWGADDEQDLRSGGFTNTEALEALGYLGE